MNALHYDPSTLPSELQTALPLLLEDGLGLTPDGHSAEGATLQVTMNDVEMGVSAFEWDGKRVMLRARTVPQVLRALANWRGFAAAGPVPAKHREKTTFASIGLMIDASRNAVPTIRTVKLILRKMALLGMNQLMLYTEDTYQVPEQPLIGYLRGAYTQDEQRELDDYAARLGVEIIPCIQALAHLEQMLRWPEFAPVRDTEGILLVDEPKTYGLLEQMLTAASSPYRTKRIHVGMDEAHGIGLGRYRQLHGAKPRFEILSAHLKKVHEMCQKMGLQPMIWSDMYFRLAAKDGEYYSQDAHIPPEVVGDIPPGLQLVYWDYYHHDPEFYREWIRRHQVADREILFAAGLWTWSAFWSIFSFTRVTSEAGLQAAREMGVREVFTTAWGDDGAEVDYLSLLTGVAHFAANSYTEVGAADDNTLRRNFRGALNADWDAWILNGRIDHPPGVPTRQETRGGTAPTDVPPEPAGIPQIHASAANPSKTLLWQDPLLGVADANLSRQWGLAEHYLQLAENLDALNANDDGWGRHVFPLAIARTLAEKAELGLSIYEAYQKGDRAALLAICDGQLPRALEAVQAQHEIHRRLWFSLYKPFGWEVLDCRYGALEARLRSVRQRLQQWLSGEVEQIEELVSPRLPVMPWVKGRLGPSLYYRRLISASVIT